MRRKSDAALIDAACSAGLRDRACARVKALCFAANAAGPYDARDSRRVGVYRVAAAVFAPSRQTSCRLIDQSHSGLRLFFNQKTICPDEFALTVPTLRFVGIVRTVWRSQCEAGVAIVRWDDSA